MPSPGVINSPLPSVISFLSRLDILVFFWSNENNSYPAFAVGNTLDSCFRCDDNRWFLHHHNKRSFSWLKVRLCCLHFSRVYDTTNTTPESMIWLTQSPFPTQSCVVGYFYVCNPTFYVIELCCLIKKYWRRLTTYLLGSLSL